MKINTGTREREVLKNSSGVNSERMHCGRRKAGRAQGGMEAISLLWPQLNAHSVRELEGETRLLM